MVKKLSISLPEQMDAEIEELVKKGVFSTKTAVIEEGLRMLFMKYSRFEFDTLQEKILEKLWSSR